MQRQPTRFFLPGPTWVPPDLLEAMVRPMVAHRSPEFGRVYRTVTEGLRPAFRTRGDVLTATGSATLVMEAAVASTVPPDGKVLNLVAGAFSERWHRVCASLGRRADRVEVPWGRIVDPGLLRRTLARAPSAYDAVTVVHNETSTGVLQPLEELAEVIREAGDTLILVDAVSSLGGAPVETDAWGLDVVLTASQKALALPPGLAFFTLSERAARRAGAVRHRGFYTDLLRYRDRHRRAVEEGDTGGTLTTPAIPVFYAAEAGVARLRREGMEARWRRHRRLQAVTAAWAAAAGVAFASQPEYSSPTVSCFRAPEGMGETPGLVEALAEQGLIIGAGYGPWKMDTFRIGHMGEVQEDDLRQLFPVLDDTLDRLR